MSAQSCLCSSTLFFCEAQNNTLPYYDSAWSKPYEPFRIAGNLYYVGTYDLACFLITTSEGNILINTGLSESVPMIRRNIEVLGFRFDDIKILLITQGHYDHAAGMAEIKNATGAKLMVHEGDVQVLADGGKSDFALGGTNSSFTPVVVDRALKNNDVVQLGDTKLTVLHHPGHTKGSTSFLVDVKDETRTWKVLIANMPTILRETRIMGMPAYPAVGKDYGYTFDAMKKIEFDLWIASHAGQFKMHQKRKPSDPYRPEVFADRPGYDALVQELELEYKRRMDAEKK